MSLYHRVEPVSAEVLDQRPAKHSSALGVLILNTLAEEKVAHAAISRFLAAWASQAALASSEVG